MACPYCGEPEDELDGIHEFLDGGYPYIGVIYDAHCNACGKHFRQKYWAEVDDNRYENIKVE